MRYCFVFLLYGLSSECFTYFADQAHLQHLLFLRCVSVLSFPAWQTTGTVTEWG